MQTSLFDPPIENFSDVDADAFCENLLASMDELLEVMPRNPPDIINISGGQLHYYQRWQFGEWLDQLFEYLLHRIRWQQPSIFVAGKKIRIPRKQCWQGEKGSDMIYSGVKFLPEPFDPVVYCLKCLIEKSVKTSFNSVLINLYRNGDDSVGWHADDEKELGDKPIIASLSLGAPRKFCLKLKLRFKESEFWQTSHSTNSVLGNINTHKQEFMLNKGDLLVMGGNTQKYWVHSLPKTKKVSGPRINMTFRNIM